MKVFLTGGTGFVGSYMSRRLIETGHEVVILTRHERAAASMPPEAKYTVGDPGKPGPWQDRLAECDTVINLAGASIFTRWNSAARKVIVDSRVLTTRHVVDALAAGRQGKETLLLSASAVGYYGGRQDDAILDETSPP
jgi:NAD dependent epimerase/dehydratase family enzyme